MPIGDASTINNLSPMWGTLLGCLLLNEHISWPMFVSNQCGKQNLPCSAGCAPVHATGLQCTGAGLGHGKVHRCRPPARSHAVHRCSPPACTAPHVQCTGASPGRALNCTQGFGQAPMPTGCMSASACQYFYSAINAAHGKVLKCTHLPPEFVLVAQATGVGTVAHGVAAHNCGARCLVSHTVAWVMCPTGTHLAQLNFCVPAVPLPG